MTLYGASVAHYHIHIGFLFIKRKVLTVVRTRSERTIEGDHHSIIIEGDFLYHIVDQQYALQQKGLFVVGAKLGL